MERYSGIADCKRSKQPASTSDLRDGKCRARRPPPLFACRPPRRRDEREYGSGFSGGEKMDK